MPGSQTDLCNTALGTIGEARITAIDDGSKNANRCKEAYLTILEEMLEYAHWSFATRRVKLAQVAYPTPLFEYAFSYGKPNDFIKLQEYIGGNSTSTSSPPFGRVATFPPYDPPYKVEDEFILSYDADAWIVYTWRQENTARWSPTFWQATMHMLASHLANSIAKDTSKAEHERVVALGLRDQAAGIDGQQHSVVAYVSNDLTTRIR